MRTPARTRYAYRPTTIGAVFAMATIGTTAAHGGTIIGPLPYLSAADSPFFGLTGWVLEDFEDGSFNTVGVSASAGSVIGPGSTTDSVDGDDGVIDGWGTAGHSFFAGNGSLGITFVFDSGVLGAAPTSAGIVWTDGGGATTFRAFDTAGGLIGEITATSATGGFNGQTDEDRFYGVTFAGGIGSIFISNLANGVEVDHLQFVVPAPGSISLLAGGALLVGRRRR
jgi:hypothetical protein